MKFQIHCSVFQTRSSWVTKRGKGRESVPRYWITIGKEVVWDFPEMFLDREVICVYGSHKIQMTLRDAYYMRSQYKWIGNTIRAYIHTPRTDLLTVDFTEDNYGLVDIFRAVDRRIGKEKRKPYIEALYRNETR